ncbi:tetratricopeptide repeat protein [Sphingobium sp.]|uniref:tetratricopeptide repeat protein n=1 Tax=Sphingobium sp. TaxID=1912891 RepID=UPI003BB72B35
MIALWFLLQLSDDIVVTGQRLRDAQAQCVRGECTPLRDAQATIALAEVEFRDGDYLDAKSLLNAAIARNRDKATQAPRAVAAMYEAYATVSLHEGDKEAYRQAVRNQVRTLRDNLPADDPSVVSAATELGDMWIKLGNYRQADATFEAVERDALTHGSERSAMLAGMKRAWLAEARGRSEQAVAMLDALEKRPLAQDAGFRTALRVLRIRLTARRAKDGEIDKLIAQVGDGQGASPVLIWSPPYGMDAVSTANANARAFGAPDPIVTGSSDLNGVRWIDIGFWVRPDGKTDGIEILRGSTSTAWAAPVLRQIAGRRYAATQTAGQGAAEQGAYRVERFTPRAEYRTPVGSHIKRRIAIGGYEVLDLTRQADAPSS